MTTALRQEGGRNGGSAIWRLHSDVPRIGNGRRILHIATRFLQGGAERNIAHFVGWEVAAGFDVEVAFGHDAEIADVPNHVSHHRLEWLTRNVHPGRDLLALRELRALIGRGRYDIVHTHLSKAGILGRLAARGRARKIAHTVHMASFGSGYHPAASELFKRAERWCAPIADTIAFVGNDLLQQYLATGIVNSERCVVVRSPIAIDALVATRGWSSARRHEFRDRLGIPDGAPLMVAIGALHPRKRYGMMLTELASVLLDADAHLAIAGEGEERSSLERLIDRLGIGDRAHLLGHVPDVTALLGSTDLLVHASAVEGVPQVVIQALAAGRPVVATDVTGLREIPNAPVRIVSQSGSGLAAAATEWLAGSPRPVDIPALSAWTCEEIDARIASFHNQLDRRHT